MRPCPGPITTDFHEPRPVSDPGKHIHGAIDIGAPVGEPIRAPEAGVYMYWVAIRHKDGEYWPHEVIINDMKFYWSNYFYDMYGGLILVLSGDGKRVHIIAHSYVNQLFNKNGKLQVRTYEEKIDKRFPLLAVYSKAEVCREGEKLGYVGNAGYSTGSHIHWEIHNGWSWDVWDKRINPEVWDGAI